VQYEARNVGEKSDTFWDLSLCHLHQFERLSAAEAGVEAEAGRHALYWQWLVPREWMVVDCCAGRSEDEREM
jgi:hypothetical protein